MKIFKEVENKEKSICPLKERWLIFLHRVEKILLREMKEQDFRNFWNYLGSLKTERNQEEEAKIFLYGVSIFILMTLIASGNFIFASNFHIHYKMTNAQAKEDCDFKIAESSELNADVELINKYKLKSPEKICEEAKNQKQSSGICGKDDEEEIKKIVEEEKAEMRKIMARRKPAIRAPGPYVFEKDEAGRKVCNKKNDHPGKSKQNKGKHMDMECCLDPDEIPNPHCFYSQSKYGKYL